jgi:hypothetical protein
MQAALARERAVGPGRGTSNPFSRPFSIREVQVVIVDRAEMRPALLGQEHVDEADAVARRVRLSSRGSAADIESSTPLDRAIVGR